MPTPLSFFSDQAIVQTTFSPVHPILVKVTAKIRKAAADGRLQAYLESPRSEWLGAFHPSIGVAFLWVSAGLIIHGPFAIIGIILAVPAIAMIAYRPFLEKLAQRTDFLPYYISPLDPIRDILEWFVVQAMYATYPMRTGRKSHDEPISPKGHLRMRVLDAYPTDFTVPWSINPHMKPETVRVNRIAAALEFENRVRQETKHGVETQFIPMRRDLADLAFTANAGRVGTDPNGKRIFVPPHFSKEVRQGETAVLIDYMKKQGYEIRDVAGDHWEGEGDALVHEDDRHGTVSFGGYGSLANGLRSNRESQERVAKEFGQRFVGLELIDPNFYHFDTAFCSLGNGRSALYYPGAFSEEALAQINANVSDPIALTKEEAYDFSANALVVGSFIYMHKVSPRLRAELFKRGFEVIETPMTEFLKSGGSVKCSSLVLWRARSIAHHRLPNDPLAELSNLDRHSSFHRNVLSHYLHSAEPLGVTKSQLAQAMKPVQDIEVESTFKMDDGSWATVYPGWRIVAGYPGKGGTRSTDDTERSDIRPLELDMELKPTKDVTIHQQPLRGGKGGLRLNLAKLSPTERVRAIRSYVTSVMDAVWLRDHRVAFGSQFDTPAPDLGTSDPDVNLMDYFADEVLRWQVEHANVILPWLRENDIYTAQDLDKLVAEAPAEGDMAKMLPYADRVLSMRAAGRLNSLRLMATVTGKSLKYGGIQGRGNATGKGMLFSLIDLMKRLGLDPRSASMAIEGMGNVGYGAAIMHEAAGISVKAIAEFDSKKKQSFTLATDQGMDRTLLGRMLKYKNQHHELIGFRDNDAGITFISKTDFWKLAVTVVAPSARQETVTAQVARILSSSVKILLEGANGSTTPDADVILAERGIWVIPDIVANAGGVLVSWMEMLQNLEINGEPWSEKFVYEYLEILIQNRMQQLFDYISEHPGKTLREATYEIWIRTHISQISFSTNGFHGPMESFAVTAQNGHYGLREAA